MNNLNGQWILLAAVIVAILFFVLSGKRKQWYTVYLKNNDVVMVYRKSADWFWYDSSWMMAFELPDGRHIKISKSQIVKVVQEREEPKDIAK